MRRQMFSLTLLLLSLSVIARAQDSQPTVTQRLENVRTERLAGLAKVWGAVKYFHPHVAYKDVDWDRALVKAIPQVRAAQSPQEYEAAINFMLAALGDKNTRARVVGGKPKGDGHNPQAEIKEPILVEDGVLTIDALAAARAIARANNRLPELLTKTNQSIPAAKAILIDLRSGGELDEGVAFFLDYYLRAVVPAMLDKDVLLASLRYRIHNGYAPQTGSTSGGYYSGMVTATPTTLAGSNKTKTPPIIFLVNESAPAVELIGGLQAAKLALVVQDGEAAEESGVSLYRMQLPDGVEVLMRTAELVSPDGRVGFAADLTAPKTQAKAAALRLLAENRFGSGATREVEVVRTLARQDPKVLAALSRTTPVVQVLPSGFGYVDLARLQGHEVDQMFETMKSTPAVIFDMRGYPNGTAWSIAPRLTEKTNVAAALFSRPIREASNFTSPDFAGGTNFTFTQHLPERSGDVYKGKVVMLINEEAISQAEHTCMFFESATDVTFIGTPTVGANGDVTNLVLPGNIFVSFSGHDVRHADGRQLQRLGIQPTIRVEPTIRGTAEGCDEILEAAVKFLQSGK